VRHNVLTLALVAVGGGLALASFSLGRGAHDLRQEDEEKEAVLATVQSYVALSGAGRFDDVACITGRMPEVALRTWPQEKTATDQENTDRPTGWTVMTSASKDGDQKTRLRWVREDYAGNLFQFPTRIVLVREVQVKDNLAKVAVHFGHDEKYQVLPWVFMLARDGKSGTWKIYDIRTPAYAEDYYP
jgi:hypothetical protein